MSKRVLIVEPSLAVRGIAESLLRQNGYEVVAAETVAAAREILGGSKIDLLLVASDINDDTGNPYFESLGADSSTATLPLLILHDPAAGGEIAYPPEAIINKPFTPRDFLESVAAFGGGQAAAESSPLSGEDFEDALIDSALGLDKIEVDDAEVMEDDSSVYRKPDKKSKVESMIGFEYKVSADDTTKTSKKKIDAINVPPESVKSGEKSAPKRDPEKAKDKDEQEFLGDEKEPSFIRPPNLSESSKIEIVTDQYGITAPEEITGPGGTDPDGDHDYDWFLKELQKEGSEEKAPPATDEKQTAAPPKATESHQVSKPPPPAQPQAPPEKASSEEPPSTHTEAVDKFISEFKKEMEKITGDAAGSIEVTNIAPQETSESEPPLKSELAWEEGLEKISPAKIRGISRELIEIIADKIAEKIVARLDEDIIYHLIKDSIDNILQQNREIKEKKQA